MGSGLSAEAFPDQARIVFKWRSKTLDMKRHSTYKYSNLVCRGCNNGEEDVHHVMNCNIDPDDPDFLVVKDSRKLRDLTVESANSLCAQIEPIASFRDQVNLNRTLHHPKCKNQGCVWGTLTCLQEVSAAGTRRSGGVNFGPSSNVA